MEVGVYTLPLGTPREDVWGIERNRFGGRIIAPSFISSVRQLTDVSS